ncbi:MAG: hypothetical protein PWQ96_222 [Clostridia bacterium]|nr:tripartite ATP-independent periplasmic transporter DctQ component [Clostridiales bacterium]MDK2984580.1 hypothetical protein [Clostridia bacterium]
MGISQDLVIEKKTGKDYVKETAEAKIECQAGVISRLEKVNVYLNRGLAIIAGFSLVLMMMTVVLNGVIRFFGVPFYGTTEIVGWMCAVTIAFSLGYTQLHKGYVDIDFLMEKLPLPLQNCIRSITLFISTIFFALVSWQLCLYALTIAGNGNVSETMRLTFYPLIFVVALGFAGLTLALLVDFLKQLSGGAS